TLLYTLSLHDALPISRHRGVAPAHVPRRDARAAHAGQRGHPSLAHGRRRSTERHRDRPATFAGRWLTGRRGSPLSWPPAIAPRRSEEDTSELQSPYDL